MELAEARRRGRALLPSRPEGAPSYRPWAQLLARTFEVDVLACPKRHGRMRLLATVQDPANVTRYLAGVGEATEVPPPLARARPPVLEEPRAPPAGAR